MRVGSLRLGTTAPAASAGRSEPALLVVDIGVNKLLIGLGQVHDAFNQADDTHDARQKAAAQHRHAHHDDAFGGVAQVELMDAQCTDDDAENASNNLLVRTS